MTPDRYVYRTKNFSPSPYQQSLARALYGILEKSIHDLSEIVGELNKSDVRSPEGTPWTELTFRHEMDRLGEWPNSAGGPLGTRIHASKLAGPDKGGKK